MLSALFDIYTSRLSFIDDDGTPLTSSKPDRHLVTKNNKYQLRKSENQFHAAKFKTTTTVNVTDWLSGVFHWVKATIRQYLGRINDSEAKDVAKSVATRCKNPGDALLLTFNGGAHSAIIVKTAKGLAYLSYHSDGDVKGYEPEEVQSDIEAATVSKLKNEIKRYKANDLSRNVVRLTGMETGKMIDFFNQVNIPGEYQLRSNNCATIASSTLKQGLPEEVLKKHPEIMSACNFPSLAQWRAKKIAHDVNALAKTAVKEVTRNVSTADGNDFYSLKSYYRQRLSRPGISKKC